MSHIWVSHVTHVDELRDMRIRYVTRMNVSCHTYEWAMSHISVDWFVESWLICWTQITEMECRLCLRKCRPYLRHDSFICVTRIIWICNMNLTCMKHASLMRATWLIYICDMPRSYVRHDSSICVTHISTSCICVVMHMCCNQISCVHTFSN